jgi:hypothetical protein
VDRLEAGDSRQLFAQAPSESPDHRAERLGQMVALEPGRSQHLGQAITLQPGLPELPFQRRGRWNGMGQPDLLLQLAHPVVEPEPLLVEIRGHVPQVRGPPRPIAQVASRSRNRSSLCTRETCGRERSGISVRPFRR